MGLFDTIFFEEAPIDNIQNFQTKSLEKALREYWITKDNLLQVFNTITKEWENTNITGAIELHILANTFWYQLEIYVIDGKIRKIHRKDKIKME